MQLAFSHKGSRLAASWGTHVCSVHDVETTARVAHFGGKGQTLPWLGFVLSFSHDDRFLATGGALAPLALFQIAPIQPVPSIQLVQAKGMCTEFSIKPHVFRKLSQASKEYAPLAFAVVTAERVVMVHRLYPKNKGSCDNTIILSHRQKTTTYT